jgi:2-dehydro-3-deoxyphosphogluconate aldolase/(4S)-4-hydroxy-2-oxoglutarate aldolase
MKSHLPAEVLERLEHCGVAAVLMIDEVERAVPAARALLEGGIDVMELTLRTPCAVDALRRIRADVPAMLAGVGTVLQAGQVNEIAEAGAAFALAPGTNPRVIAAARARGLPFIPGIATPSDIESAVELGCRELKFFPAEPSGGLSYLRNVSAPYAHLGLRFLPLGGLSAKNLPDYMSEPAILAVGGSWLATRSMIQAEAWDKIRSQAAEARKIIDATRQSHGLGCSRSEPSKIGADDLPRSSRHAGT